jgi:hypothetical protein
MPYEEEAVDPCRSFARALWQEREVGRPVFCCVPVWHLRQECSASLHEHKHSPDAQEHSQDDQQRARQEDLEAKERRDRDGTVQGRLAGRTDQVRTFVRRVRTFTLCRAHGKHRQGSPFVY